MLPRYDSAVAPLDRTKSNLLTLINCPNIAYSWKIHYLCIGKKYNNEAG